MNDLGLSYLNLLFLVELQRDYTTEAIVVCHKNKLFSMLLNNEKQFAKTVYTYTGIK